jgi:hypothetical protein
MLMPMPPSQFACDAVARTLGGVELAAPVRPVDDERGDAAQVAAFRAGVAMDMTDTLVEWHRSGRMPPADAYANDGGPFGLGPSRWTLLREGASETELPDGTRILLGGSHNEHSEQQLFVYNDAVVVSPAGDRAAVYAYSRLAFPPTDYHAAVRMEGDDGACIWVIGSMGDDLLSKLAARAPTQVCRLDLRTMTMARVEAVGEGPAWAFFGHPCSLPGDGCQALDEHRIEVRFDGAVWELDTRDARWTIVREAQSEDQ